LGPCTVQDWKNLTAFTVEISSEGDCDGKSVEIIGKNQYRKSRNPNPRDTAAAQISLSAVWTKQCIIR
jgi:hypothetical protein